MSERELVTMLEFADATVQQIFKLTKRIFPMWHMVTATGETKLMPSPSEDKDIAARRVRALFEELDVVRYVFVSEAWTVDIKPEDYPKIVGWLNREGSLENYPGRSECLKMQGEDSESSAQLSWSRAIIRPKIGSARLGDLEKNASWKSDGRMVGLLPKRKATHH